MLLIFQLAIYKSLKQVSLTLPILSLLKIAEALEVELSEFKAEMILLFN